MYWKLPLLLCLILIGFPNCQGETTAGSDIDDLPTAAAVPGITAGLDVADAGAGNNVVTTAAAAAAADVADETDAVTAAAANAAADVATLPDIPGELDKTPTPKAEAVEAETTQGSSDSAAVEAATTQGSSDSATTERGTTQGSSDSAPVEAATTQGSSDSPAVEAGTTQGSADSAAVTTAAVEDATTAVPTLPDPGNEQPGPPATEVPKEQMTTIGEEETVETTIEAVVITTAAPETTTAEWSGEPCETPHILEQQVERHFTATVGNKPVNDRNLKKNWYRFEYEGAPAIITSQPIKPEQCGTEVPFHLNLKGKDLPQTDSNGTYDICSSVNTKYGLIRCTEAQPVVVKNCGDKYVYELNPVDWTGSQKAKVGICVQKPGEIVPLHYLAISQEESGNLKDLPVTSVDDVSKEQLEGIVTVELKYPDDRGDKTDTEFLKEKDKIYRPMVVRALNGLPKPTEAPTKEEPTKAAEEVVQKEKDDNVAQPPPKEDALAPEEKLDIPNNLDSDADLQGPRSAPLVANPRFLYKRDLTRVKRSSDHEYKVDDVHYVGPTPRIKNNVLQKSVYVDDPETTAVDADRLLAAIKSLHKSGDLGNDLNLTVLDIYKGLPRDIQPLVTPVASQSTWKKHEGVFITIIVLLLLLLLILLIGCCCIKCRNRRGSWTANHPPKGKGKKGKPSPKKSLTAHESPLADDEIKKDEGNMMERENPAYTANGSGGHIAKPTKDDEQGWIVPIDELNRAELNRPDVQDTKL